MAICWLLLLLLLQLLTVTPQLLPHLSKWQALVCHHLLTLLFLHLMLLGAEVWGALLYFLRQEKLLGYWACLCARWTGGTPAARQVECRKRPNPSQKTDGLRFEFVD